ncbi:lipoprotein NlpI [Tripterygium wilfordii]|uniref:lipoprotein NlpI n=1 Tax=Tripterygium wilfordii TaxID=458696 RepID=UPI0018F80B06|nr:lipoprotein NlpI [Tripterygium wilfordii]
MASFHISKPSSTTSSSSSIRHRFYFSVLPPISLKTHTKFNFLYTNPLRLIHNSQHPPLTFSRRLFLPSVSGIWDAFRGNDNAREAILAIRRGMLLFRQGDVLGSLAEFDKAIELDPRQKAYLWQRGLSLYYLDRFEDGAEQFRFDVAQNPNDTEESIWCFLCEAKLYGVQGARKRFLKVGRDPRPVMRETYNLFKDGGYPEKLVAAFSNGRESEYFYASLYAGLYHESQNKLDSAKFHIMAACQSSYGQRSDDYMVSLAKVHCLCRNWSTE